jgi:hypothetical protein
MSLKTLPLSPDGRFAATVMPLAVNALANVKFAFTTRRVDRDDLASLVYGKAAPRAGDLALAQVVRVGGTNRLQAPTGRRSMLFVGDEIVVAYGNRYAPDQFEAIVPADLGECQLVASGGIAGEVLARRSGVRAPTQIKPLGLLADRAGNPINLRQYALPAASAGARHARVIAVVGTAMNAGKTTAVAHLVKGLVRAGQRVAAIKVTGTGAANDLSSYEDAGASPVFDFTDAGYASTYCLTNTEVVGCFAQLVAHAQQPSIDYVVVEVADGLLQRETAALLQSRTFRDSVDGTIFCAGDALGAVAGIDWLEQRGLTALAVSGVLSASPLAIAEARRATRLPVLTREELAQAECASRLVAGRR